MLRMPLSGPRYANTALGRRSLVLTVLLGDSGAHFVEKAAGRTVKHWGKLLTDAIPMPTIIKINRHLGAQFITKYGTKRRLMVLGRLAPRVRHVHRSVGAMPAHAAKLSAVDGPKQRLIPTFLAARLDSHGSCGSYPAAPLGIASFLIPPGRARFAHQMARARG
jgi:hypothetical protein